MSQVSLQQAKQFNPELFVILPAPQAMQTLQTRGGFNQSAEPALCTLGHNPAETLVRKQQLPDYLLALMQFL